MTQQKKTRPITEVRILREMEEATVLQELYEEIKEQRPKTTRQEALFHGCNIRTFRGGTSLLGYLSRRLLYERPGVMQLTPDQITACLDIVEFVQYTQSHARVLESNYRRAFNLRLKTPTEERTDALMQEGRDETP